jgi:GNAT superfamily N-acetyltransferase
MNRAWTPTTGTTRNCASDASSLLCPQTVSAFGIARRKTSSDLQAYLCASVGQKAIGFGSLTIKNNLWQAGYLGHIDEFVVDAEYRGRGVGTRLLTRLVELAREHGCRRVELDSAFERVGAHAFYKRHGFENRAFLFSKPL